jgi:hypothetical protein
METVIYHVKGCVGDWCGKCGDTVILERPAVRRAVGTSCKPHTVPPLCRENYVKTLIPQEISIFEARSSPSLEKLMNVTGGYARRRTTSL